MSNDAQRMKPDGAAAPDYAYRIAGDVLRDWEPDDPGTSVSTLGALAEAARRGYELGYGAAQSR